MHWSLEEIFNGAVLGLQGCVIALQNPDIHRSNFLQTIFYLTAISMGIYFVTTGLIWLPLLFIRIIVYIASPILRFDHTTATSIIDSTSKMIRDALFSLPLLMLMFTRYLNQKPLDDLFMDSLEFVDEYNTSNRRSNKPAYYPVLKRLNCNYGIIAGLKGYYGRTYKKVRASCTLYILSLIPLIGRFVIPLTGAYTITQTLGHTPAIIIGVLTLLFPNQQKYIFNALSTAYAMRALTRDLLEPYFNRLSSEMTANQRARWFRDRKSVLFGFSLVAYILSTMPVIGVFGFGLAQASAAYVLVSVTDSPIPTTKTEKEVSPRSPTNTTSSRNLNRIGNEFLKQAMQNVEMSQQTTMRNRDKKVGAAEETDDIIELDVRGQAQKDLQQFQNRPFFDL